MTRGGPASGGRCRRHRRYSLRSRKKRPLAGRPRVRIGFPLRGRSSGGLPLRTGSALAAGPA
eukprot:9727404-Lingulodinium_polyedra.AAC.1